MKRLSETSYVISKNGEKFPYAYEIENLNLSQLKDMGCEIYSDSLIGNLKNK